MTYLINLASALGLKPLDRLQINNRRTINDCVLDRRQGREDELPYWFFQQVLPDGRIEVRTPGGYVDAVDVSDVCDIIPGDPVIVQAMPPSVFLERLRMGHKVPPAGPECFSPAYVLYVMKDRWNRIDGVSVRFLDEAMNREKTTFSPIPQAERDRLQATANRNLMPVMAKSNSNYSADKGVKSAQIAASYTVGQFIKSSLAGKTSAVERISMAGAKPLSVATLNRLIAG